MKQFHYYFLIAIVSLLIQGCNNDDYVPGGHDLDFYWLTVSFKDASGKDLVAPLADERWRMEADKNLSDWPGTINPERYKLDIILSNPHESWDNTIYNSRARAGYSPDVNRPYFSISKYNADYEGTLTYTGDDIDGCCYLFSNFNIPAINGVQNTLSYKITCPTIFGDSSIHEIVTYWTDNSKDTNKVSSRRPECKAAKFDGNEVLVKKVLVDATSNQKYYSYFVDIILDK